MIHEEPVLVALWVEREGKADWFAGVAELPRVFHLHCIAPSKKVNFRYQTGNLAGEPKRKCELLMAHGFTVVRVPPLLTHFANSDPTSQHQIIQAAVNHLDELYRSGKVIMEHYDEEFGRKVITVIASRHPKRLQMMEVKEALAPEPTDEELLLALDALSIDGYIEGKSLIESSTGKGKLAAMADMVSTKAGREWLRGPAHMPEHGGISNLHFHAPVGAVGHNSVGSVTINQQWTAAAPEPDWTAVSAAFKDAVVLKSQSASSSDDYLTVAALAKAQEEANQKNKTGFLDTISKLGQSVLPILTTAGAHGLVSYLEHELGWKLN